MRSVPENDTMSTAAHPARAVVELDGTDLPAHCQNPKRLLW